MASDQFPLIVIRSPAAIEEMHEIWLWNAQNHGDSHADQHLRFLKESIADLAGKHARGKVVPILSSPRLCGEKPRRGWKDIEE